MTQNLALQLYRNGIPVKDFATAKTTLEGFSNRKDGEIIACRYNEGDTGNVVVKTALGIYYVSGDTVKCTILKDAVAMEEDFKKVIEDLDVTDNEVDGSVVIKVDQEDGVVSNIKKAIKDIKLVGYASTGEDGSLQLADGDTIQDALNKIETYIKGLDAVYGDTDGKALVGITQTNGKIVATPGNIKASTVTIEDAGSIIEATTVEDALTEIAGKVGKNQVTNADGTIIVTPGTTTDIKVNVKSGDKILSVDDSNGGVQTTLTVVKKTSGLAANIKESYEVQGIGGEILGEAINIYKDSSLKSVELVDEDDKSQKGQFLKFTYITENGTENVVYVDVSKFLVESEFKNGLEVSSNGEVSVKIKQNDKYLEVSQDGVASKGIDTAIETAINDLESEVTSTNGINVQVKVTQTNGEISAVDITTDDTASTTQLNTEIANRKAVTGVDADTYTAKADANYIQAATSLKDADEKLDAELKTQAGEISALKDKVGDESVEESIKDALEDLTVEIKGGPGKFIQSIKQDDGVITATESDLTATNVSATKLNGGTAETVQGILEELNTKVEGVKDSAISVVAGHGITITDGSTNTTEKTIAVKIQDNDPILEVNANGLGIKDGAVIDCGTY